MPDSATDEMIYDRICPGGQLPASAMHITSDLARDWVTTLFGSCDQVFNYGDPVPAYVWPSFIVPAFFAAIPNRPYGGAHAKQQLRFGVPLRVGDELTTTIEIIDKYIRRERPYVVSRSLTLNQAGETVLDGEMTSLWPR